MTEYRGHRSHVSLSSFDDIRELQAVKRKQYELQSQVATPSSTLVRPLSLDDNEASYQSIQFTHRHVKQVTVGTVQWTSPFVVKNANERRALIRYPNQFPVCSMHLASITIQRWWRSLRANVRTKRSDRRILADPTWQHPYHKLIDHVNRHPLPIIRQSMVSQTVEDEYFHNKAKIIQRSYHAYRARKHARYQRRALYSKAAISIQNSWRAYLARQTTRETRFIRSIISIQRAWRSFANRRVYRYFRDLIRSREASDPHQVLQSLGESDDCSGLYVRFRLGGSQFPPLIYYKIFTKQSITDIGAFAPRNYALDERRNRERTKAVHSVKQHDSSTDVSSWYRRYENNGWRLMSALQLNGSQYDDEVTIRTSNVRVWHHPNKLVRASEARRKRKQKQIAWKKSLYGISTREPSINEEKECVSYVKFPQIGVRHTVDEGNEHEELDDLLDWCESLSFDDYADSWTGIGTTDAQPQRIAVKLPAVRR